MELWQFLLPGFIFLSVPNVEAGCCVGSEGNGVSVGKGGEGGPGPAERGKHRQLTLKKGRDNMGKDVEDQPSRP
jgi:hypothetical protein